MQYFNDSDDYKHIMDSLMYHGNVEEWERFAETIEGFPHGCDDFINRRWIINAIDCGVKGAVEWMLSKKVDLHFSDEEGRTVLISCLDRDKLDKYEILQLLIDHGADINLQGWNDWTPLHMAGARNDLRAIKLLIDNGASQTIKTRIDGYCTPEEESLVLGNAEAAELIRTYKAFAGK